MTTMLISIVFICGYILIATEHFIKINKAATAILTGVICWTLLVLGNNTNGISEKLMEHVSAISGILFFLMGAMTIVELIDAHNGFATVTALLGKGSKLKLLWVTGFLTFFLSSVLDNLTTTIVMVSLLSKLLSTRDDLLVFTGLVVIAANAGGAWTPIGDVTTTMLWIGGQITTLSIMKLLFIPSMVCLLVPLAGMSFMMKGPVSSPETTKPDLLSKAEKRTGSLVFFCGIGALLFVPVFKTITHLPPFIGIMLGLSLLWILTEILHRGSTEEKRRSHSVSRALQRIDLPSILFFLGILLCISALQTAGILSTVALWLNKTIGNISIIVIATGLLSAIVDNVPLVAAAIKMYPLSLYPTDHHFWSFLSYCVGTGGSALIIGSAAGVAAMGMTNINFFWYCKRITPIALAGYFAGAGAYLLLGKLF